MRDQVPTYEQRQMQYNDNQLEEAQSVAGAEDDCLCCGDRTSAPGRYGYRCPDCIESIATAEQDTNE